MSNNEVTEFLEKLKQENERLLNKLIFANNCLKYSIEFISFVDLIFNKIKNKIGENDISKYKEYVNKYECMLKGNN